MKQIIISGIIGWDATPQQLREALAAAKGEDVEIVISSPGGFVGDGIEMFNLIRNYPGQTVARLSGYAMSMASYIPLAAKRIVAEDNAIYMIHNARGGVFGDHNDILTYGEATQGMSRMFARAYAKRTSKSVDEVQAMMDKETYFFGQDMVDHGFVDEIITTGDDVDKQAAIAFACAVHSDCLAKMSADQQAIKNDLVRMAAICGAAESTKPTRAQANAAPASKGEAAMNMQQLKAEHPDLVAAIVAEAREGMLTTADLQAQIATARAEGAAAEQARIADVRAQALPGHEALIEQLAADGKSTGADAAKAIVAAEAKLRADNGAAAVKEANAPAAAVAAESADGQGKTMKRKEFDKLDQQARRAFFAAGGKLVD